MRRILVTGATGSFGRYVARELLGCGCDLVVLGHGRDKTDAMLRVRAALGAVTPRRVTVVRGDLTLPGLGLRRADARLLEASVDGVLHAAAVTAFGLPLELARRSNVEGTRNVVAFAQGIPGLRKLGYVSTTFVAGKRTGRILESELAHDAGFVTTYEQSKYEAELLVRKQVQAIPLVILRPSVIVSGEPERKPSGLRFTLSLIERGLLPALPAAFDTRLDLIDAADAAHAVAAAFLGPGRTGTFHVASGDCAARVADIVRAVNAPPVSFLDEASFARTIVRLKRDRPWAAALYDQLSTFVAILAYPKIFATAGTEAMLGGPVQRVDPLADFRPHVSRSACLAPHGGQTIRVARTAVARGR